MFKELMSEKLEKNLKEAKLIYPKGKMFYSATTGSKHKSNGKFTTSENGDILTDKDSTGCVFSAVHDRWGKIV